MSDDKKCEIIYKFPLIQYENGDLQINKMCNLENRKLPVLSRRKDINAKNPVSFLKTVLASMSKVLNFWVRNVDENREFLIKYRIGNSLQPLKKYRNFSLKSYYFLL